MSAWHLSFICLCLAAWLALPAPGCGPSPDDAGKDRAGGTVQGAPDRSRIEGILLRMEEDPASLAELCNELRAIGAPAAEPVFAALLAGTHARAEHALTRCLEEKALPHLVGRMRDGDDPTGEKARAMVRRISFHGRLEGEVAADLAKILIDVVANQSSRRPEGYGRSALVRLLSEPSALELAGASLTHPDDLVREAAVSALARQQEGAERYAADFVPLLGPETPERLRQSAFYHAPRILGADAAAAAILEAVRGRELSAGEQRVVDNALQRTGSPVALDYIISSFGNNLGHARYLAGIEDERAVRALLPWLHQLENPTLLSWAVVGMGTNRHAESLDRLLELVELLRRGETLQYNTRRNILKELVRSIGMIGDPRAVPVLESLFYDPPEPWAGSRAAMVLPAEALGMIGSVEAYAALHRAFGEEELRLAALEGFAKRSDGAVARFIEYYRQKPDKELAAAVIDRLLEKSRPPVLGAASPVVAAFLRDLPVGEAQVPGNRFPLGSGRYLISREGMARIEFHGVNGEEPRRELSLYFLRIDGRWKQVGSRGRD